MSTYRYAVVKYSKSYEVTDSFDEGWEPYKVIEADYGRVWLVLRKEV